MIELINVKKTYKAKKTSDTVALDDISFKIPSKGLYFITGESGSGKSTLLNVLGGLDKIDSGSIKVGNINLENLSKKDLVSYRNTCVGFIFQDYNLFLEYNVYDNVKLALELSNQNNNTDIDEILKRVGLYDLRLRNINELSGGQRQRVAIARALVKNPKIILADEPTGNLDSATSRQIMELLKEISENKCIIVVTHDKTLAAEFGRGFITMQDGKVINDTIVALKDDDKNIALRTSNFKSRYAFKFTLHNLKMKPVKFVVTTILTAFALMCVCIMLTFVFFDKNKFTEKTLVDNNITKLAIEKTNCRKEYDLDVLCEPLYLQEGEDILKLGSPVYNIFDMRLTFGPTKEDIYSTSSNEQQYNVVEIKNDNILNLYIGRLPAKDDEIVIDKNIAYTIMEYGIYNSNKELIKPNTFQDILNITTTLDKYPVTIVGINEFPNDEAFQDYRNNTKVTKKIADYFKGLSEYNNIYVKGFIDNKELIYTEDELINRIVFTLNDRQSESTIGSPIPSNKVAYYNNKEYYDMNFNLSTNPIQSNEIILDASTILNLYSTRIGYLSKKFNTYQQEHNDLTYNDALFAFTKDIISEYGSDFYVITFNSVSSRKNVNNYQELKVVGITFEGESYISSDAYNIFDHNKKGIEKIYIGYDNQDELKSLIKNYSYTGNIEDEGVNYGLGGDLENGISSVIMFNNRVHSYLVIIALVFILFASLLIFNFISTTISYAKKNIGILKSLGAKDKDIYKIFGYEALIIATVSFAIAIPLWNLACLLANKLFFSDYTYLNCIEIGLLSPLITLILSIFVSGFMSILCCRKINKMQPVDAILNK